MYKTQSIRLTIVLLSLLSAIHAQVARPAESGAPSSGSYMSVVVQSDYSAGVSEPLVVEASNSGGIPVARGLTDSTGRATLGPMRPGNYMVTVSGPGIQTASAFCDLSELNSSSRVFVPVSLAKHSNNSQPSVPPTIDTAEMNIPSKALKSYTKGLKEAMEHRWDAAIEDFTHAIKEYPNYSRAYSSMGLARFEQQNYAEAEAAFDKALAISPSNAMAMRGIARVKLMHNEFAAAEAQLLSSAKYEPNNSEMWLLLAWAQMKLQKFDDSIASALRVDPANTTLAQAATSRCVAAEGYQAKGDAQNAIELFDKCIKMNPNSPNAKIAKSHLAQLRGSR